MMSDFTPRAQQVLALARKEAERFKHNYVGTEHLMLGLIKLGQGVAVNVLQNMGLDLERVRMEVEKHVGSRPETNMIGNIPYTPRVKKVLALAGKEAQALHHSYIGTEHILLGLLREGEGVAAQVLKSLEVDPARKGRVAGDGAVDEIERDVQLVRECFGEFGINTTSTLRMLRRILPRGTSESDLERGRLHRSSESREVFSRAERVANVFAGDVRALHMLFALLEIRNNSIDIILKESECSAVELRSFALSQLLKAKWIVPRAKDRRRREFPFFGRN